MRHEHLLVLICRSHSLALARGRKTGEDAAGFGSGEHHFHRERQTRAHGFLTF